jgi:hypothetical protein
MMIMMLSGPSHGARSPGRGEGDCVKEGRGKEGERERRPLALPFFPPPFTQSPSLASRAPSPSAMSFPFTLNGTTSTVVSPGELPVM